MGVGGADNPLWLDVLEWGSDSAYAGWFDIDWEPHRGYLHDKLLVPVLGDQYGIELDAGKLVLKLDEDGRRARRLGLRPPQAADLPADVRRRAGRRASRRSSGSATSSARSSSGSRRSARRAAELKRELAAAVRGDDGVRDALAAALERVNRPDDDGVRRALDAVIQKQYWRAAHFRVAGDDINYRRFFNINDLAGLRIELPEVFEHVHRLVLELVGNGVVAGLRIDHIDGLLEPQAYLDAVARSARARRRARLLRRRREDPGARRDAARVVARRRHDGLRVRRRRVAAAARSSRRSAADAALSRAHRRARAVRRRRARREAEDHAQRDGERGQRAGARCRAGRASEPSHGGLHARFAAHGACASSSRASPSIAPMSMRPAAARRRTCESSARRVAAARRRAAELDPSVFAFLARMLSGKLVEAPRSGFSRAAVLRCAMKFQQLSGPIMAKGLEDTAFYRYNRFIALNDVGGDAAAHRPRRRGVPRAERGARAALAADAVGDRDARHEARRGRARAARRAHGAAGRMGRAGARVAALAARRRAGRTRRPTRTTSTTSISRCSARGRRSFATRGELDDGALAAFARAPARRAAQGRARGEAPLELGRARRALRSGAARPRRHGARNTRPSNEFLARFVPFASRVARLGVHNSLVQLALKLTAPGVPDIYQGCELWDFSLVDPDNRRPVDFERRAALLEAVEQGLARRPRAGVRAVAAASGRTAASSSPRRARCCELRAREAALFAAGDYAACEVTGPRADEIVAFVRRHERRFVLTAVQRFPVRAERSGDWRGTSIRLPRDAAGAVDVFTGRTVHGAALDPRSCSRRCRSRCSRRRMMLHELAAVSAALAATRSRSEKVRLLAECLRALAPDERETAVAWLSGVLLRRQGQPRAGRAPCGASARRRSSRR